MVKQSAQIVCYIIWKVNGQRFVISIRQKNETYSTQGLEPRLSYEIKRRVFAIHFSADDEAPTGHLMRP
jgi:hypothetical protein